MGSKVNKPNSFKFLPVKRFLSEIKVILIDKAHYSLEELFLTQCEF